MGRYNDMRERVIPENVLQGKRILGFKRRNFFEGIIMALIVSFLVRQIPFVEKVSWIVMICLGLFIFLVNAIGIHGQPILQVLFRFFRYRKYTRQYSYRRLENGSRESKPLIVNGKVRTITESRTMENIKKIIGK